MKSPQGLFGLTALAAFNFKASDDFNLRSADDFNLRSGDDDDFNLRSADDFNLRFEAELVAAVVVTAVVAGGFVVSFLTTGA